MSGDAIAFTQELGDDTAPLAEALRRGFTRPLVLWAHPGIGQSAILEDAARAVGLPFRPLDAGELESWDGFRDVTESGNFREMSLERFLAKGEAADPRLFNLAPGTVLCLRAVNLLPARVVQAVLEQVLDEGKLLNNPLPPEVRVVATALPADRTMALALLGPRLRESWEKLSDRAAFKHPTYPLPKGVIKRCEHWAVLPSVPRFLAWGASKGLAREVIAFLEKLQERDPDRALATLHAGLVRQVELFPQLASPRSFADLGALLVERRPYFSSHAVREALARAKSFAELQGWLHGEMARWDPDRWIEADSSLTWKGESVTGNVWLRNYIAKVGQGEAEIGPDDLTTYSAYERRSLEVWATQELGDDIGQELVAATVLPAAEIERLAGRA